MTTLPVNLVAKIQAILSACHQVARLLSLRLSEESNGLVFDDFVNVFFWGMKAETQCVKNI
jgi:hypothetical protein